MSNQWVRTSEGVYKAEGFNGTVGISKHVSMQTGRADEVVWQCYVNGKLTGPGMSTLTDAKAYAESKLLNRPKKTDQSAFVKRVHSDIIRYKHRLADQIEEYCKDELISSAMSVAALLKKLREDIHA